MKLGNSEEVLEFLARTGGMFSSEILSKIFSRRAFLLFLERRKEIEYVYKHGVANYIYKIPDRYIDEYYNTRWKKEKELNSKGMLEFRKRVVSYIKANGLKGKYKSFARERFYNDIYQEMLVKKENEKKYWNYYFNGLNEAHIISSLAMQLLYISDYVIPYTKGRLVENFPPHFIPFSGKGMYFSIIEDERGADRNCCIIIESLKSHESIFKTIEKFGVDATIKNRCVFYIISGNLTSIKMLENRIKNYKKAVKDSSGNFVKYEDSYFRYQKINFRYYKELDRILNRGVR